MVPEISAAERRILNSKLSLETRVMYSGRRGVSVDMFALLGRDGRGDDGKRSLLVVFYREE
jgi:hypothetical protein